MSGSRHDRQPGRRSCAAKVLARLCAKRGGGCGATTSPPCRAVGWPSGVSATGCRAAMPSPEFSSCGCRRFARRSPGRHGGTFSFWSWGRRSRRVAARLGAGVENGQEAERLPHRIAHEARHVSGRHALLPPGRQKPALIDIPCAKRLKHEPSGPAHRRRDTCSDRRPRHDDWTAGHEGAGAPSLGSTRGAPVQGRSRRASSGRSCAWETPSRRV